MKRPSMYIGPIEEMNYLVWILDDNKIIEKEISYSAGLYKIFDEIIVNAYDQTIRDSTVSYISVHINKDRNQISIYNDGKGIDVVIHPKEKIYVPELIFGYLMTSTSFDENVIRITGGVHGLGAKLTAIFSRYFKVEVGDPINKKSFSQIYKKNLSIRTKPIIKDYNKPNGYVRITFQPDLKYFKINELSNDLISLMKRRVYDLGALTRKDIKVYLNDTKLSVKTLEDYVPLFTDKPYIKGRCEPESINKDRWNIIISKSDGNHKQISYVNGIYTMKGGYHVSYILNRIVKEIKAYIQKKYKSTKIKDTFIKDQLWIFVSSVIENPTFPSQTKDELMTPIDKFGSTCILSKNLITKLIKRFGLDTIFKDQISILQQSELRKTVIKRKSAIKGIKKLYDANYAGTKKSKECTLILTEGDSAKTMAISGLSAIPKSNNYYGVFPLKGKLINVRVATHKQILNNEEFKNLKNILGLKPNKKYNTDNINELRYGSVLLMMDADVDGSHIKGLFINMIDYYWSSLLEIEGFIKIFITPIVKAIRLSNRETLSFFTVEDFNKWKSSINMKGYTIKYYKGLGTNTAEEARQYFRDLDSHIINMVWNDKTKQALQLAFEKKQASDRKLWLKKYDKDITVDYNKKKLSYYDFIHKELIHFSNYDNIRSIPNIMDGLKPSQRKVLYSSFKRQLRQDIKVAQFVGYVSEHTSYHHGETSLAKTIIGMAQNYIGSNNINLLSPKGQFGSRLNGGKDHSSPRYIFTNLEKVTRLIFRKEDDPLLNYLKDDGYQIEPEYYIPIIPTILINGSEGIGTGYSTFIPKYKPQDIITTIKNKLLGSKYKLIDPWYNKFKGSINKINKDVYYSKGTYDKEKNYIFIKELPISTWTENYKQKLDDLTIKYKYIKGIKNNSNETDIDFTIKFDSPEVINNLEKEVNKGINGIEKLFDLVTSINLTNMHLYSSKLSIKKYNTVKQIIDEFFNVRLEYYHKRKQYLLQQLDKKIKVLKSKVKFIELVIKRKINIFNVPKDKIIKTLEYNKLLRLPNEPPYDYLIKMSFYSLTKEKITELRRLLNKKTKEYNILKKMKVEDIWLSDLDELEEMLTNKN
jgi:DNA topoisomerase-2